MTNDLNIIKTYNDMLYDSRPVSFNEFINDKYNNVHNELYNDALNKYYNDVIDKFISSKFLYEFYKNMQNNSDTFETFYNHIESLDNNTYLKTALYNFGVNSKELLNEMFDLTCNLLDNVKEYIKNKNIIKGISSIADISDFRILYVYNATFISPENEYEIFDNIFASYKFQKDSNINSYNIIEENAYMTESSNFVFILEEEDGTRIGYNSIGEWILILDSNTNFKTLNEYNNESNSNININEFNNLKNDMINNITNKSRCLINLYKKYALDKYKSYHKIIEIKNSEYWMPSTIYIISNIKPYKKEKVDLTQYWNMIQSMQDLHIYDIKNTNENINDSELYEINYVTGIAKIRSKNTGLEYETPFKYLDGDINVSEDMTLNKAFNPQYNEYYQ